MLLGFVEAVQDTEVPQEHNATNRMQCRGICTPYLPAETAQKGESSYFEAIAASRDACSGRMRHKIQLLWLIPPGHNTRTRELKADCKPTRLLPNAVFHRCA